MSAEGNRSRVVVIDAQKLRQAGLVRLLEDWAGSKNLEIVATAAPEDRSVWPDCGMVVVNVGGASVVDDGPRLWIRSVKTFVPAAPIAILSDREDCGEIRTAFKAGVSGFIPTNLEPALAMEALTFLLRGGSFFPCSVLLEESRSVREDTSRALRGEPNVSALAQVERPATSMPAYSTPGWHPRPDPEHCDEVAADDNRWASPERQRHSTRRWTQVRIAARQRTRDTASSRVEASGADSLFSHRPEESGSDQAPSLTPRQREVLERLSEGKSNKLIARDLDMTEATVKVHVRQIMRKFGASNRTQAALIAMRFATMVRRVR